MSSWTRYVASMGKMKNAYRISVGKLQGKKLIGKPGYEWEYNIKMDLSNIGCRQT
jgi:hypothetical protein